MLINWETEGKGKDLIDLNENGLICGVELRDRCKEAKGRFNYEREAQNVHSGVLCHIYFGDTYFYCNMTIGSISNSDSRQLAINATIKFNSRKGTPMGKDYYYYY